MGTQPHQNPRFWSGSGITLEYPNFGYPVHTLEIHMTTGINYFLLFFRLTAVSVDPGVKTPGDDNADQYDVIYVGTTKGKVFKIVSSHSVFGKYPKPVISEEIQVFPYHVAVKNLQVVNDKLIVVSDHEVRKL